MRRLTVFLMILFTLTACGPSQQELEATMKTAVAVSAATQVAAYRLTMEAQATPTRMPPTATLPPTSTATPLPTNTRAPTATRTSTPTSGPVKTLPAGAKSATPPPGPSTYPCVSYYDQSLGSLKYACNKTWQINKWIIQTVDKGDVGLYSSLAYDSQGNPRISYFNQGSGDLMFAAYSDGKWNIQAVETDGITGLFTTLLIADGDNPLISYYDKGKGAAKLARWQDGGWIITQIAQVGSTGDNNHGSFQVAMALNKEGNPLIAFQVDNGKTLKLARYQDEQWKVETVENFENAGFEFSLALDADGNPAISYYDADPDSRSLKLARFNGQKWVLEQVDTRQKAGRFSSLAFDNRGNPRVAYYEDTFDRLIYTPWTGKEWYPMTLEWQSGAGTHASLAVDLNNYPVLAYYETMRQDLKVVRMLVNGKWDFHWVDTPGTVGLYPSLKLVTNR